ncbi:MULTISPECIES: hypothetical protein [unclassified Bradyrhizobium]|uniref:hypothetical protein n=1 Tax=unclassified Bradyrhizobium TaxID=2631580 RepID=UPI0029160B3B|nr:MULTISPECIES: hypothetical protein [unclassified Bradyrhizobium]
MEKRSGVKVMRTEIAILAGPRRWGDTRESWLARVPRTIKEVLKTRTETVSFRMVKGLWYGEINDPEHHAARDVRRAAGIIAARNEALALAEKYRALIGGMNATDPNFYREDIARLERVARMLCGEGRPE